MDKKYELIGTDCDGFYRIKALKDFQLITGEIVKKGDIGGSVHGEHNLSQEGNCWIEYYSCVFNNSRVMDNAVLKDHSNAFDNPTISGNVIMKDYSLTRDNATVSGNAVMKDFSWAKGDSIITENAVLQAYQHIHYSTVTTDLLGTKDWIGALYAELGVSPQNNKIVLYKKVWKTDNPDVFKSDYRRNFLYKIGKISRVRNVDEDIFNICTRGLHFTSLEFVNNYGGDTILECEVKVHDIVTVQDGKVRARKCKVLRVCA
jgi:carbonic anhydrase/acetyltransferase-like protein (isoleucine patch superfamily)